MWWLVLIGCAIGFTMLMMDLKLLGYLVLSMTALYAVCEVIGAVAGQ